MKMSWLLSLDPTLSHEKQCPDCARLTQNCWHSPLAKHPLVFAMPIRLHCPYFRPKQLVPTEQLSLFQNII